MGWAEPHQSASVSAAFILVNSVAGFFGETISMHALPHAAPLWAGAVVIGGLVGSELGARQFAEVTLAQFVFIDEFGAATNMTRTRARAPRGERFWPPARLPWAWGRFPRSAA